MSVLPRFKIKKITTVDLDDVPALVECIEQYLADAKDTDVRLYHVLASIQLNLEQGVWFLYDKNEVAGFLVGYVHETRYDFKTGWVDFLFVNREARSLGWAKRLAQIGIAWVKQQGVNRIMFTTKRNAKAMCRFLPGKWEIDSTVLSSCV